ncbi:MULTISPECIES: type IVB secretion system protein IcmH/DotU [unclassified Halomonas]|uniref:type IVB secretion system protein IcmH/DotU n=1 Tax=unclassified Halomonas TaxID=2609666 RepID=UPI00209DC2AC|nr:MULTISPECIES: type IVB secretion system protein IcmH/DotU [unclassified Halomonas]MCP1315597.1 type IVB secretion system protein IcmH/DotU [Halomonas sp. 707D7]MCP1327143.1 type IVB secretion system protein IcmH/DotU [Halomonas sp. 707D4]
MQQLATDGQNTTNRAAMKGRHEDLINERGLEHLIHSHAEQLDADEDYWFRLRGHNLNPLVDAAGSLLGMVVRVRQLDHVADVERLYRQVVDEIAAIEIELTEQGYDRATLLAYRYVLCSFIDEAVMGMPWGRQSKWAEHSLLTRFHNETWGGEKVFSILARLQQEPKRYRDMLAFIYLCLCLGFEGRYRVMSHGRDEYEQIVRALGDQLSSLEPVGEDTLTHPLDNVVKGRRRRGGSFPIWGIFTLFGVAMVAVYWGFAYSLDQQAEQITTLLNQLYR